MYLVGESGVLELRLGRTICQGWPQSLGCFVQHNPATVTSNHDADEGTDHDEYGVKI